MSTSIAKIENELEKIIADSLKLYAYLYDLSYNNPNELDYVPIYEQFLEDPRSDIKAVAIKALLFSLKLRDERYRILALQYLEDRDEDEDLRTTCASSIAQAYFNTKDRELLRVLYDIFNDDDDDYLKGACFNAMLGIIGITSTEIFNRNNGIALQSSEINMGEFSKELNLILALIKD